MIPVPYTVRKNTGMTPTTYVAGESPTYKRFQYQRLRALRVLHAQPPAYAGGTGCFVEAAGAHLGHLGQPEA